MRWSNSRVGYGLVSIALHWLGAIGVIVMFAVGLSAEWAAEAGDRAKGDALMALHVALGISLFVILAARVLAHYAQPQPGAPEQARPLNLVRALTHHGLLLALMVLMMSGPLAIWSLAQPVDVWGVWSLPSPFRAENRGLHELAETLHGVGRYMLWVLVPLHLVGVLKHVIIDRDHVLARMLRVVRS